MFLCAFHDEGLDDDVDAHDKDKVVSGVEDIHSCTNTVVVDVDVDMEPILVVVRHSDDTSREGTSRVEILPTILPLQAKMMNHPA